MTITWPMAAAAACLTLALVHLRIACGDGRRAPHLFFSLTALAATAICGMELTLLCTDDLGRYNSVLRWSSIPLCLMVSSVVAFVWVFFGTGKKWLAAARDGAIWVGSEGAGLYRFSHGGLCYEGGGGDGRFPERV
jgi:hypothetical protein